MTQQQRQNIIRTSELSELSECGTTTSQQRQPQQGSLFFYGRPWVLKNEKN
jgi:hypothetical protein